MPRPKKTDPRYIAQQGCEMATGLTLTLGEAALTVLNSGSPEAAGTILKQALGYARQAHEMAQIIKGTKKP
jgi:hypothetical protein